MIEITARACSYRKGLLAAAAHLSPEEAAIIADLERHGLQVPQLHDVLCGGHVLVDDPQLYEDWRFTKVSHLRVSSHHKDIDKTRYPDIGMRGPVVREKLHGRTAQGTWVQLEKTPAAFGQRKLPSLTDLRHLMDYVVYRVTRSNARALGAVPAHRAAADVPVAGPGPPHVAGPAGGGVDGHGPAPDRAGRRRHGGVAGSRGPLPAARPAGPGERAGPGPPGPGRAGLFGNSDVWVTEAPSRTAAAILNQEARAARPGRAGRSGAS